MTSFPERIPRIAPAIDSVLRQKDPSDRFIIWLAEEEFPNGVQDIPNNIRKYSKDMGGDVEFRFTKPIRSFKKIIPALEAFPDAVIITVDDDTVYPDGTIQKLKDALARHPDSISSHCVCDLYRTHGQWRRTTGNMGFIKGFPCLRIIISAGGTIYPPHALDPIALDVQKIMALTPTNDDFWTWFCAARKGTPIRSVPHGIIRNFPIPTATTVGALSSINEVDGDKVNLRNLRNLLDFDPSLEERMIEIYSRHRLQILLCRVCRLLFWYPRQAYWCLSQVGFRFLIGEIRHKLKSMS